MVKRWGSDTVCWEGAGPEQPSLILHLTRADSFSFSQAATAGAAPRDPWACLFPICPQGAGGNGGPGLPWGASQPGPSRTLYGHLHLRGIMCRPGRTLARNTL